jgi:hypothetical protein
MEILVRFDPKRRRRGDEGPVVYPARVARQLALAHALQQRLDAREFHHYADMARVLGFTRARITQLMNLLLLAPDVQEEILFLELPAGEQPIHESQLRGLAGSIDWSEQRGLWRELMQEVAASAGCAAS